jgi:hypothetical protein
MAHNVVYLARILRDRPIPPEGNTVLGWQEMKVDGPS